MTAPIVIVGAGQAGLQAAESLRAGGHAGPLIMIGDEPRGPYHRPPLSKGVLLGETTPEQLVMRSTDFLERKGIQLVTGVRVETIDRAGARLALSDGRELAYAGLVLATGARLRPLPVPGADLKGVMGLRTLDDALGLSEALDAATDVAIIGGGFIGLEVAAAARKRGKTVTVFEALDRLMARAVSPLISGVYKDLHESHGVTVRLGAKVTALAGENGSLRAVVTEDGAETPAQLAVVGIGILANDALAAAAGLTTANGIVVDDCARTGDALVTAAGDCTARRLADGSHLRLESVQNAIEQGKSAAAALSGQERPFTATPWFWSDQYGIKLQMAGIAGGYDDVVTRGDVAARRFSAFYFRGETLVAVDSFDAPVDHMAARKLLDKGVAVSKAQAADSSVQLAPLAR